MNVVSTSSVTKSIDNGMGLNAHNNNSNNLANPALLLMKSTGGGASDVPVSSKPSIHKTLISNTLGIVSDNVLQADVCIFYKLILLDYFFILIFCCCNRY